MLINFFRVPTDLTDNFAKFIEMRGCLWLIGILFVNRICAQTTVTGSVADHTSGLPIEYASVALIHLPDSIVVKTTLTDRKGRYSLKDVAQGRYCIQCSFIGFEKEGHRNFRFLPDSKNFQ